MQFHIPESYALKEQVHPLYEDWRTSKKPAHRADLLGKMNATYQGASNYIRPFGHEGLLSYLKAMLVEFTKWNEDQPRDDHGRWTSEGGGEAGIHEAGIQSLVSRLADANRQGKEIGFSYQPFTDDTPTTGFMSSEYPERGEKMNMSDVNDQKLNDYVNKNKDLLATHPDHYFGGWLSGGTFYLDVSKRFYGQDEALSSAVDHNQAGVFDIAYENPDGTKGRTIYTTPKLNPDAAEYDRKLEQEWKDEKITVKDILSMK